jgi:SAM-dependent methyltransferase
MINTQRTQQAAAPATDYPWGDVLGCPKCGSRLARLGDQLRCKPCAKKWPIADGIPTFVENAPYWCEIPTEALVNVNGLTRRMHWKAALLQSEELSVRKAADTIQNAESANWHWLTDLGPQARVLDIGAGLGTQSYALSCRFREVFALEPSREQAEFMRARFAQEGVRNVTVLRASPLDLPFPPGSFDLVALNGALQRLAAGSDRNPRELQIATLTKVFDVLAPGGYLSIGTPNRMAWKGFVGEPDPDCGLPYVTLLPRPLAHWYGKRRGHSGGYRAYSYSVRGYRKLLAAAGFTSLQFYVVLPSYRTPRVYLPLEENVFTYYHKNFEPVRSGAVATVATWALSRFRVLKYLQHSFVILARKGA